MKFDQVSTSLRQGPNAGLTLSRRTLWTVFIVVFLIGLSFALYTEHAWEDYWITFRISKNLATGHGMVYTVGEKVHAFTSPLGTLLPAFLGLVTGNRSDELVLWLFRLLGCGLLGLTAVLLLRIARATGMSLFPAVLMVGLFAFDAKTVDFSINGMETAFMVFFLAAMFFVLTVRPEGFVLKLGLAWAGLMWTRPDGIVYISGLALGYLLFRPASGYFASRKEVARKFLLAGLVTTAVYLPWVLWTWRYFGSPIPHTVMAKGVHLREAGLALVAKLLTFPFHFRFDGPVADTFMPPLYWLGGWPEILVYASSVTGAVCAYYWCLPFARPQGRAASFALCLAYFYLTHVVHFVGAWYIPSVTLLCIIVLGNIAQQAAQAVESLKGRFQAGIIAAAKTMLVSMGVGALLASALLTTAVAYQMKVQQEVIEEGHRKQVGIWLKEQASAPRDTVFLECLGYIGYYSQLKMLDFPGLSSPEVVAVRTRLHTDDFAALIEQLRPDWLVLRPVEAGSVTASRPALLSGQYARVAEFDVTEKLNSYSFVPGRALLEWDRTFIVYKKKG